MMKRQSKISRVSRSCWWLCCYLVHSRKSIIKSLHEEMLSRYGSPNMLSHRVESFKNYYFGGSMQHSLYVLCMTFLEMLKIHWSLSHNYWKCYAIRNKVLQHFPKLTWLKNEIINFYVLHLRILRNTFLLTMKPLSVKSSRK